MPTKSHSTHLVHNETLSPVVAALQQFLEELTSSDVVQHHIGQFKNRRTFTIVMSPAPTPPERSTAWHDTNLSGSKGTDLLLSDKELAKKLEKCKIPNTLCLTLPRRTKKKSKPPAKMARHLRKVRDLLG